jgi:hypothetical protein
MLHPKQETASVECTMKVASGVVFLASTMVSAACTSPPVLAEMEACHLTPEAKQELRLTAEQERQVSSAYSNLEAERQQVEAARARRRQTGTTPEEIDRVTKELIDLERRCREQIHPALKSILTDDQYGRVLVMEENHQKRIQARRQTQ